MFPQESVVALNTVLSAAALARDSNRETNCMMRVPRQRNPYNWSIKRLTTMIPVKSRSRRKTSKSSMNEQRALETG
jgi:hypothetical protein